MPKRTAPKAVFDAALESLDGPLTVPPFTHSITDEIAKLREIMRGSDAIAKLLGNKKASPKSQLLAEKVSELIGAVECAMKAKDSNQAIMLAYALGCHVTAANWEPSVSKLRKQANVRNGGHSGRKTTKRNEKTRKEQIRGAISALHESEPSLSITKIGIKIEDEKSKHRKRTFPDGRIERERIPGSQEYGWGRDSIESVARAMKCEGLLPNLK